jgi:D-amino-acid dehydrogenase
MSERRGQAVVVGAGIVGICCAAALLRAGYRVRVLDENAPGTGCSQGNAGILSTAAVLPLATPDILRSVPRMLMDPDSALKMRWLNLPRLVPWLARFAAAGTPGRVEAISRSLASIAAPALAAYAPLLVEAGAEALVHTGGYLELYRTEAGFAGAGAKARYRKARGVAVQVLDAPAIQALEPALSRELVAGVRLPESGFTVNPFRLAQILAAHVERHGGRIERCRVTGFGRFAEDGPKAVLTTSGEMPADLVVVATGAWSKPLAKALGVSVPLIGHRGYHAMLPHAGGMLNRPVVAGEAHIVMSPMEQGLCLTGTLELGMLSDPPVYDRALAMVREVPRWLPGIDVRDARLWSGFRPALPDSLPVIARAPRWRNALLAFGHGAMGLTLGAITGQLIAELATGRPTAIDLAPFAVDRF